jgi:mRNA capping enzyme, beta chain
MDNGMKEAIIRIKEVFDKYRNTENLEVEYRLGYSNGTFKTDIGKECFDKISAVLKTSDLVVVRTKSEDYFLDSKRLSIEPEKPEKSVCITKEKLAVLDFSFEKTGFDLRVSFSRETPTEPFPKEEASFKRTKDRISYISGGPSTVSYDITRITHENNTLQDHSYEFELEWLEADPKTSSHYCIHDCLLKIKDVVAMCEEIDDCAKFTAVSKPESGLMQMFVSQHMMNDWKYSPGDNAWSNAENKVKVNECVKVKTVAFRINSDEITALGNIA